MSHLNRSRPSNDGTPLGLSVPVLAYHKIDGGFELGVNSISPQVFDRQMRFLAEHGYTTITVDPFIQAIEAFSRQNKSSEGHSFSSSQLPQRSTSRLKQEEDKRTPYPLSPQGVDL